MSDSVANERGPTAIDREGVTAKAIGSIPAGLAQMSATRIMALEQLWAVITDDVARGIVQMATDGWPPELAAGARTDWMEHCLRNAISDGVRRGYELAGDEEAVAYFDQLSAMDRGEASWCRRCIERRLAA